MDTELKDKINTLLTDVPYITIASVTLEGFPWNSPVFAVHDDEYNFIWNSSMESQHSKNISQKKDVFIVIYNSKVSEGDGFGLYIQAQAKELVGKELQDALVLWYTKKNKPLKSVSEFLASGTQRLYKATPTLCWVNGFDKTKSPSDYRIQINLDELK